MHENSASCACLGVLQADLDVLRHTGQSECSLSRADHTLGISANSAHGRLENILACIENQSGA